MIRARPGNPRERPSIAWKALLPFVQQNDQKDVALWQAAGRAGLALEDDRVCAAALEALQRLRPCGG